MKIFLDTNIFLDLILKRECYRSALIILNAVERGIFEGVVLDITLLNIDDVAKKQVKDIRTFLDLVNQTFEVVGASNQMFSKALELKNQDLEDNLQFVCAQATTCDLIVTNDGDFAYDGMEIVTSDEFVKRYLN